MSLPAFNALEAAQFDVITLWHVLEHVHALNETVQQLRVLLKPDGRIYIAVPNYTSMDAAYFGPCWAAYDVPRHLYHFSPPAMRQLMSRNQLKVYSIKPMWFDSFYVSLLSEKYKKNPLGPIVAFFIGMISNVIALVKGNCSSVIYVIKPV
jgi:SAM-dependent methyltransferase